jgi:hypothetical protein
MVAVLVLIILGASPSTNWNSTLGGVMRYAVWVIPVLAWLATEGRPAPPIAIGVVLALHAALLAMPAVPDVVHSRLAQAALAYTPRWYRPDPEIFGERLLQLQWRWRERVPLGFTRSDGTISSILTDAAGLAQLERVFSTDPSYLARVSATHGNRADLFYLTPPRGVVRARCLPERFDADHFRRDIHVTVVGVPDRVVARQTGVLVSIANRGTRPLCDLGAGGADAVNLTFRISAGTEPNLTGSEPRMHVHVARTRGPQVILPGESATQAVEIVLPAESGRYALDIVPVLEGRTFGSPGARFNVDVGRSDRGEYIATASAQS